MQYQKHENPCLGQASKLLGEGIRYTAPKIWYNAIESYVVSSPLRSTLSRHGERSRDLQDRTP